jgi:hypothetical protein
MAIRVNFELMDDLDGTISTDIEPVVFGIDGQTYKIDLTPANAARLRRRLADFVDAARRVA